ncbi:tellurite resistance TerB family protein [Mailhella massiliensis]|uniref:Tellurite resistance TerB family protein n=1 Tax=Mailhella massiliensis TaxID=1903261 RepID=A0A921AXM4_9BACT|nr:tellurite resistance TerB family protein [Mailhella massiliensis]HJD98018.1 tellurite resistance TerB family protein [Mailhella massiliensis]
MSLFDILNDSGLKSTLESFSAKAGKAVSTVSSQTPGGLGGLLGAGALGALLGTFVSKSVLKDAALIGAGAVAWNFYQKWSRNRNSMGTERPLPAEGAEASSVTARTENAFPDATAMLMLRAMVYTARADGHIDEAERGRIVRLTEQLFPGRDISAAMDDLMGDPINPDLLAREVQAPEQAEDVYRLSCLIVDIDHFMERSYLDALALALRISPERKAALESEVLEAKQKLLEG